MLLKLYFSFNKTKLNVFFVGFQLAASVFRMLNFCYLNRLTITMMIVNIKIVNLL